MWKFTQLAVLLGIFSCKGGENIGLSLDETLYSVFGHTLFIKPELVSFKEVHLGMDHVEKKFVMISGRVLEIGSHQTYLVLGDHEDRLIVATTSVIGSNDKKMAIGSHIGVVGMVESGKKGMPFLRAHAIHIKGSSKG